MKQVFQMIPRGSSNTMLQDKGLVNKMRKHCLLSVLIAVLIGSIALVWASADVSVSESYVKPGYSVDFVFTGTPGSNFTVSLSNSRRTLENVSLTFDGTGRHVWSYMVNETAYTDSIRIRAAIDGTVTESGFIISKMEPRQLAETMRIMAGNSRKQAESALMEARKTGKLDPEILTRFRDASELLADSKGYAEQDEHTKAFEAIKTALTRFKTIIDDTFSTDVAPTTTPENETAKLRAQEVLKDLTGRIVELNRTAGNLEDNGFNVDVLREEIKRMSEGLKLAQTAVDSNNLGEAARHIRAVDEHLNKVQDNIKQRMQEHNQLKVSRYQTSLQNRYNTMRDTLTILQVANTDKVTIVLADMDSIEGKLDEARGLYDGGDISGSIKVLHNADRRFKEAFARINGDESRMLLNSLDLLASQLENEQSPMNRIRLQRRMESMKSSLTTRLEEDPPEPMRPIPRPPADSNNESITP